MWGKLLDSKTEALSFRGQDRSTNETRFPKYFCAGFCVGGLDWFSPIEPATNDGYGKTRPGYPSQFVLDHVRCFLQHRLVPRLIAACRSLRRALSLVSAVWSYILNFGPHLAADPPRTTLHHGLYCIYITYEPHRGRYKPKL